MRGGARVSSMLPLRWPSSRRERAGRRLPQRPRPDGGNGAPGLQKLRQSNLRERVHRLRNRREVLNREPNRANCTDRSAYLGYKRGRKPRPRPRSEGLHAEVRSHRRPSQQNQNVDEQPGYVEAVGSRRGRGGDRGRALCA